MSISGSEHPSFFNREDHEMISNGEDVGCKQSKNQPKKSEIMKLSIINLSNQLHKLSTAEDIYDNNAIHNKLRLFKRLYKSLLNILSKDTEMDGWGDLQAHEINLIDPLVKLISFVMKQELTDECTELIEIFTSLIWQHLAKPYLFNSLMEFFTFDGNKESGFNSFTKSFLDLSSDKPQTGIFSFWNSKKFIFQQEGLENASIKKILHESSLGFLYFLQENFLKFYYLVMELNDCLNIKDDVIKDQNSRLFEVLTKVIESMDNDNNIELISLLIANKKDLLIKLDALEHSTSDGFSVLNKKCISKIFTIVTDTLIVQYPGLLLSKKEIFKDKIRNKNLLKFTFFETVTSEQVSNSITFILELLDQSTNLNYLASYNLSNYLLLSLKQINGLINNKLELYSYFNSLKSKLSITTVSLNLNFIISLNLLNIFDNVDIPQLILVNFNQLFLQPLPKSNSFFDKSCDKDVFEIDHQLTNNKGNFNKLLESLILNLNILLKCFKDELSAFQFMSTFASNQIYQKLVFKTVDLIMSSLFSTLAFIEKFHDNGNLNFRIINSLIYKIFYELVNINLMTINNSLIWISLVNFTNDICYSDIRYVSVFEKLYNYLINEDLNILENSLVKSGLEFFVATFNKGETKFEIFKELIHDETLLSGSRIELPIDEYKFLYLNRELSPKSFNAIGSSIPEMEPTSTAISYNDQDLANNMSTPIRPNYVTNSARQQSVHVDQFGKI